MTIGESLRPEVALVHHSTQNGMAPMIAKRRSTAACAVLSKSSPNSKSMNSLPDALNRRLIRFVTEGILTRRLLTDPSLTGVDAVVLDELHERHLNSDFALALSKRLQRTRPNLRIVVMSATLDAAPVARYLDNCPILRSEGRLFELTIKHLPYSSALTCTGQVRSEVAARRRTSWPYPGLLAWSCGNTAHDARVRGGCTTNRTARSAAPWRSVTGREGPSSLPQPTTKAHSCHQRRGEFSDGRGCNCCHRQWSSSRCDLLSMDGPTDSARRSSEQGFGEATQADRSPTKHSEVSKMRQARQSSQEEPTASTYLNRHSTSRLCSAGSSKVRRAQPVDATLACSLLAGVSKPKVFRGR
jgi:hypothetical protein